MNERVAVADRYEWTALSVTTVGALLASIQGSALTIALPEILTGLQAGFLTIMWVLLGYLLITTALVPVIGRLADMFGRKNLYNAGFAIFTLGSLLAGLSQPQFHAWDMVALTGHPGRGGGAPVHQQHRDRHGRIRARQDRPRPRREPDCRGGGLSPRAGDRRSADGGFLAMGLPRERSSGHIRHRVGNAPPEGARPSGTLPDIRLAGKPHLHLRPRRHAPGALPACLSPASAFRSSTSSWGAAWPVSLLFFAVEVRAPQPMLDLRLFRHRLFSFASLANALNGLARGAVLFVLIFFLQGPYGKDPLQAGIMMAPFGAAFMLVGPFSGYLSDKHGSRGLATAGLLVSAVGLFGLSRIGASTPYWLIALFMVLMGGGSGLFSSPNTNTIMSSVAARAPRQRGGHPHHAHEHGSDAEHLDRLPPRAEPHPPGCDVQDLPLRRRHGRRATCPGKLHSMGFTRCSGSPWRSRWWLRSSPRCSPLTRQAVSAREAQEP